eukprot:GHVR01006349.1.p1 GENE.GHVR01006349.1~~GHVR01006349.1.p1  ORF type:complete len:257 (+),score=31.10 GHVR01006349.1:49-771(+)
MSANVNSAGLSDSTTEVERTNPPASLNFIKGLDEDVYDSPNAKLCHIPPFTDLTAIVLPFAKADNGRAWWIVTSTCILTIYFLGITVNDYRYMPIAALFFVRLFIIFHDCCHGAFFKERETNQFVANILAIPLSSPRSVWDEYHNAHHNHLNIFDKDGQSNVPFVSCLDISLFSQASFLQRLFWCFTYGPITRWPLVTYFVFLIYFRFTAKCWENVVFWSIVLSCIVFQFNVFIAWLLTG